MYFGVRTWFLGLALLVSIPVQAQESRPRRESGDHRPTTGTDASQTMYVFVQVKASAFEDNPFLFEHVLFLTQA